MTTLSGYANPAVPVRRSPSDVIAPGITFTDLAGWESRYGALDDVHPLTALQSGMVIESMIGAGGGVDVYVTQTTLRLSGPLDLERLAAAISEVLRVHPNLRAAVCAADEGTYVAVIPARPVIPQIVSESSSGSSISENDLDRVLDRDRRIPFDLTEPPLLRASVLTADGNEHLVVLTMHHLLADGWSTPPLVQAILDAYRSPDARPAPDTVYPRFLSWLLERDPGESQRAWTNALAAVTEPTLVAQNAGGMPTASDAFPDLIVHETDAIATRRLTDLATARGTTFNAVVQSAWALTLNAITGHRTVVFGSTVSGRPAEIDGIDTAIGMFINTVAVPVTVDGLSSAAELIDSVHRGNLAVLDHHHIALTEAHRITGLPALFDTLVVYENYPADEDTPTTEGTSVTGVDMRDSTHYPLTVGVLPGPEHTTFEFAFRPEYLDRATVSRFVDIFGRVLEAFTAEPETRIAGLDLVPSTDRDRLDAWSTGPVAALPDTTLDSLIQGRIEGSPTATALVDDNTGTSVTYRQFGIRVDGLVRALLDHGVGSGDRVAVMLPRSIDLVVALVAVMRAGAAYVPIDPDFPVERVTRILTDAAPAATITTTRSIEQSGDATGEVIVLTGGQPSAEEQTPPAIANPASPADAAYVIFTSGTTGRPKGVQVSHSAIVNRLEWMRQDYGITEADHILQKTPSVFDVSVWEFFLPLSIGGTLVIARDGGHRDPAYLVDVIERHRVTVLHFVPAMLRAFLDGAPDPTRLASVRRVFFSGEALPGSAAAAAHELFAPAQLHNLYGPTEAAVDVTGRPVTAHEHADAVVPIGVPVANTTTRVLDSWLRPAPIGSIGELYLGGVQLADGYVGRPDLTADRFVADPTGTGERLYRTGDLVRWNLEGHLEYLGRSDHQVKVRGFRIELDDIRATLERHDDVTGAIVLAVDRPEQGTYLVAYITARTQVDLDALRAWTAERLPEYMVPTVVVTIDRFPTTPNGKLDRGALPEPILEVGGGRAPNSEAEHAIAAAFQDVLRLPEDSAISVEDDFFRLGGDSILAARLVARAGRLGWPMSIRDVFEKRSVEALAAAHHIPTPAAEPIPLPAYPVLELLRESGAAPNAWVYTRTVRLPVADTSRPREILRSVIERTDALRTTVTPVSKRLWTAEVAPAGSIDPAARIVDVDAATDPGDAAEQATSLVDITVGASIAAAIIPSTTDTVVVLVGHAAALDRQALDRVARLLSESTAVADTAGSPTLLQTWESMDAEGPNVSSGTLAAWVEAAAVPAADPASELFHPGSFHRRTLTGDTSTSTRIADALGAVAETFGSAIGIDVETAVAEDRPPIGPFTTPVPHRAPMGPGGIPGAGDRLDPRDYVLLRFHNRSGRRALRKLPDATALVTRSYGSIADPAAAEGVETRYRCVVRYRIEDAAVHLEVLGLSEEAVDALVGGLTR